MKNHFYSNEIAKKIRTLLDENLPNDVVHNITIGDLSILPGPDDISEYLPAIVINIDSMEIQPANEAMGINYTPYYFTIYYICPFGSAGDSAAYVISKGKSNAQKVANILMNRRTLENFTIEKSDTEAGGLVISSQLSRIAFESAETEFFRMVEIPVYVASLDFVVGFRSFAQRV